MSLKISKFESFSTLDGEGVRCVVFLAGCSYHCPYCHNPETRYGNYEEFTTEEIFKKIKRSAPYFGEKGGVTFSGGECLLQAEELLPLLVECKKQNYSVALDTTGGIISKEVEKLLDYVDFVLLDIKSGNALEYEKIFGGNLSTVLQFWKLCVEKNVRVILRHVVVEGWNTSDENIKELKSLITDYEYEDLQFLPYHTLGVQKYEELNLDYPLKNVKATSLDALKEFERKFWNML